MKRSMLFGLLSLALSGPAVAVDIHGAGSSFAAPLYEAWFIGSHNQDTIDYAPVGSGEGIKRVTAKTVDFGASDAPLTAAELESKGLLQFPTATSALVPFFNIPGVYAGQLVLTGPILVEIYNGTLTKWNDAKITALNPSVKLPNLSITVVHRSDDSGSSYAFTDYLSQVSADWKSQVGRGLNVKWPTGTAAKGGKGMITAVATAPGAIGYIEYSSAVENKLNYALLKNRDGAVAKPLPENVTAAAAAGQMNSSNGFAEASLANSPGVKSWPLTTATFVLLPKTATNTANAKRVLKFLDWGFRYSDIVSGGLGFVALPKALVEQIHANWGVLQDEAGTPLYTK
ncbi:MAG: phosphate ABC transporter substrate-binding protein PstS [Nitrosomonadales bacterium]|nr:phosphate ABC transporter substrate-binding protein PstS [Nitrosomonadales bacterium]